MIHELNTVEDVKQFIKDIISEGVNFHPDTPFEDYINNETCKATYTEEQADLRNDLLTEAFTVCNNQSVDIYELSMEILLYETGLDQFIPSSESLK